MDAQLARCAAPRLAAGSVAVLRATLSAAASGSSGMPLLARLKRLATLVWPISRRSTPFWAGLTLVAYVLWGRVFLLRRETNAVRVQREKKKKLLQERMVSILAYAAKEMEKEEKDRKMPEASRVYALVWDEVHGVKMTSHGIDGGSDDYKAVVDLLKKSISRELLKCIDLTQRARKAKAARRSGEKAERVVDADEAENFKAVAEHESGEKLKGKIKQVEEIEKNLGAEAVVDAEEVSQAKALMKSVRAEQRSEDQALMKLIKPMMGKIALVIGVATVNGILQGIFHQLRFWNMAVEQVSQGGLAEGRATLLFLLGGHVLIKALGLIERSFTNFAEYKLGQSVRNGVLNAMMRQDFEYFYRNSPGVLQDRLNRDANELGNNVIRFPARNCARVARILTVLIQLIVNQPLRLTIPALIPMIVMSTTMRFSFKMFHRMHQRARRVEEDSIKDTAEVLREIKTVRQFAMETNEAANYARAGEGRYQMVERIFIWRHVLDTTLWTLFDSGLCLTIFMGFPLLQSGAISTVDMMDLWAKISFNLNFELQALMNELSEVQQLLEPLGRICDLLDSKPLIEPNPATDPASIDLNSKGELDRLLGMCEVCWSEASRQQRTVATADLAADVPSPAPAFWPEQGQQLISLTCSDFHFVKVGDAQSIDTARLDYPVRATFSTKLRPLKFKGKIEFRDVVFRYPTDLRKPVLQKMSFVVEPGQKVALVGSTGCGKSTCMQLLQRLYEPLDGEILIDDIPIEDYDIHYLRSRIVIVDQHTVLFNASIRENIAYGVDVSDEEIIQALKDAKIWDFVQQEPDQLLSVIAEGGSNLSGGQRQRLAIARAMVRRPDVILLDEATSALDNESEAGVQEALDVLARKGSALVIAHRLSTVMDSERIYVLGGTKDKALGKQGEVIEYGTHDQLVKGLGIRPAGKQQEGESGAAEIDNSSLGQKLPALRSVPAVVSDGSELQRLSTMAGGSRSFPDESADEAPAESSTLRRQMTMPTVSSNSKEKKEVLTSYKNLWDAATGGKDEDLTVSKMEEKCKELHEEWSRLQKRVDSIREIRSKLELPGAVAEGATKQQEISTKSAGPQITRSGDSDSAALVRQVTNSLSSVGSVSDDGEESPMGG